MPTLLPISADIANIDEMSAQHHTSFIDASNIETLLMEPDDELWRFVSTKNGRKFSDFWIDKETMSAVMNIFRTWDNKSENTKKEIVKDNLAILGNWGSNLSWRVKVKIKKPVIAYKGKTGPQKYFVADAKLPDLFGVPATRLMDSRLGGFDQYVIPRFKHVTSDDNEFGIITHFVRI